jgi:hypothetical protein
MILDDAPPLIIAVRMTPAAEASLPPSGIDSREAELVEAPERGRAI